MSHKPNVPPDFEEYALEQARRIAAVDRHRLKGGDCQFKAMIQCAIVDAMMYAAELRRVPHVTIHSNRIEFSPAMPISDHEMDVLRALASRIKEKTREGGEGLPPALSLVSSLTEHGTADKPAPGKRETASGDGRDFDAMARNCRGEFDESGGISFDRKAWGFFVSDLRDSSTCTETQTGGDA